MAGRSKRKAIETEIQGIKCDNTTCAYKDLEAVFDCDYYLNRPCPSCGSSLLTPEDYRTTKRIVRLIKVLNFVLAPLMWFTKGDGEYVEGEIKMNGTGKATVELKDEQQK